MTLTLLILTKEEASSVPLCFMHIEWPLFHLAVVFWCNSTEINPNQFVAAGNKQNFRLQHDNILNYTIKHYTKWISVNVTSTLERVRLCVAGVSLPLPFLWLFFTPRLSSDLQQTQRWNKAQEDHRADPVSKQIKWVTARQYSSSCWGCSSLWQVGFFFICLYQNPVSHDVII